MSVTNKISYMSFYVIFVTIKLSIHQNYPTASEVTCLLTPEHPLRISPMVHHGVMHIHRFSPIIVIPVSANMWLVLADGYPPLLGPIGQESNF